MVVTRKKQGACTVLTPTAKDLRFEVSEAFKRAVFPYLEDGRRDMVIDLSAVDHVDSIALSTFVAAQNRLSSCGRRFALAGVNEPILRVLQLTAMDQHLKLYPSLDAALADMDVAPPAPSTPSGGDGGAGLPA